MFNNVAYFGVSSPIWGTFTMGRQSSLTSDLVVNYDALSGSNAWSLLTYEGASGGGGVTENRIYDNSYEYRLNVGPVRFAAITALPNGGNSATGLAYEGDAGFDYMGLSMDFVGGHIKDAQSAGPLSTAQVNAITSNQAGLVTVGATATPLQAIGYAIPCSLGCLSGTISTTLCSRWVRNTRSGRGSSTVGMSISRTPTRARRYFPAPLAKWLQHRHRQQQPILQRQEPEHLLGRHQIRCDADLRRHRRLLRHQAGLLHGG